MIYLELLLGFLKVGCFTFGGAYGAIPLIRDVVLSYGWMTDAQVTYMVAVSESTPGPIMVNMATFVGNTQAGLLGSLIATFAVVFPSFVIIILITALLKSAVKNPYVQAALQGLKPCVVGIVVATGVYMTAKPCLLEHGFDPGSIVIAIVLTLAMVLSPKVFKKKLSPIGLIIVSAILGMLIFGI